MQADWFTRVGETFPRPVAEMTEAERQARAMTLASVGGTKK